MQCKSILLLCVILNQTKAQLLIPNNYNSALNSLIQNYVGSQPLQQQQILNQNNSIVRNLGGQAYSILTGQQYGQNEVTQLFNTGAESTRQVLFNIIISTLLQSAIQGQFVLSNDGVSNILFQAMIRPLVNNRVNFKKNDKNFCDCGKNFFPVCGQNGITYGNECLAKCENQTFVYGSCSSANQVTTNTQQTQITPTTNTNTQQTDNQGDPIQVSVNDCRLCPSVYQPVCGSDNNTYKNTCQAQCKNITISRTGIC